MSKFLDKILHNRLEAETLLCAAFTTPMSQGNKPLHWHNLAPTLGDPKLEIKERKKGTFLTSFFLKSNEIEIFDTNDNSIKQLFPYLLTIANQLIIWFLSKRLKTRDARIITIGDCPHARKAVK